ncbi:hypothetical protein BH10ACI2_BH10ACI2_15430 [soil metagenome]
MERTRDDKLLNPIPCSQIAAASDFGIDLTQIVENLRLTPAERIKRNDQAVNSVLKFAEAMKQAKANKINEVK